VLSQRNRAMLRVIYRACPSSILNFVMIFLSRSVLLYYTLGKTVG